jgi:hypothetical protein
MQIKEFMLPKISLVFAMVLSVLLSACSPALDWRTVRSDDLLYEALYPGKPSRAEKTILFDGHKLTMTIEASKAGEALYAVSVISVSKELSKQIDVKTLMNYLQTGMLSNLKDASKPFEANATIKTAGQPSYELPAKEWIIEGLGPDQKKRLLRFRLVQRQLQDGQVQIYQQSLLQAMKDHSAIENIIRSDEHEMFFTGFKPY